MVDIVFDGSVTASTFIGPVGDAVVSEATGLLTGGALSTGAAATEYSISDGTGQIVAADGTKTDVSWTGKINITPVALLTANISFVGITAAGAVIESTAAFTNLEKRTIIQLGVAVHVNRTTVDAVNNEQYVAYNTNNQLNDLTSAIGFFNVSGNVVSPNGANLNIDKSAGDMYGVGVNYGVEINNPNVLTLALLTAATFQYRFSDGSNGTTGTVVDPDNLDDGAGGLTALANNKWSIQRAYSFTSNNLKLQRGQVSYGSKDLAIAGITSGTFVTEPSIAANGLLRGFLIMVEGTTDLSDTNDAVFVEATRFQAAGGGIGSTASTLQEVYDNSATNPEILTNSTQGAFTLRRGSAAETDDVSEVQNNAGTKVWSVTGEGVVDAAGSITAETITVGLGAGSVSTNTAVGLSCLSNASNTGTTALALGNITMTGVYSGEGATALGYNACAAASSGDFHTGVGFKSLSFIESGDRNTALGAHSGGAAGGSLAVVTGTDNTLLGYGAGGNSSALSGVIAIGSLAKANVSTGTGSGDDGPGIAIGSSVVKVGFRGDGTIYPSAGASSGYLRIKINGVIYKLDLLADS
jgi:hypothetical protein